MTAPTDASSNDGAAPFVTSDTPLVAYLTLMGHKLCDVRFSGQTCYFTFNPDPAVAADVSAFYSGAEVPARRYATALHDTKRLIAQYRDRGTRPVVSSRGVLLVPRRHGATGR